MSRWISGVRWLGFVYLRLITMGACAVPPYIHLYAMCLLGVLVLWGCCVLFVLCGWCFVFVVVGVCGVWGLLWGVTKVTRLLLLGFS